MEDRDISLHNYVHLNFDKETQIIQWKLEIIISKWHWNNWINMLKNSKSSVSSILHNTPVQVDQRPQHISNYIEPDRK